jgi:hypothetical protein
MNKVEFYKRNTNEKIVWEGDLDDDCIANWAGLILRAEWMNENNWWWCVYDALNGKIQIDSSNNYKNHYKNGESARKKAEQIAKEYLKV